jgi:hypothetical protein
MEKIARSLQTKMQPFILVLTFADKFSEAEAIAALRKKVELKTGVNEAFIIPIENCTSMHQVPSNNTQDSALLLLERVLEGAITIQQTYLSSPTLIHTLTTHTFTTHTFTTHTTPNAQHATRARNTRTPRTHMHTNTYNTHHNTHTTQKFAFLTHKL